MSSENNSVKNDSITTPDHDYDEIIRSGRELINSVYERLITEVLEDTDAPVQVTGTISRSVAAMNRHLRDVNENVRRIDRHVSSLSDESLRTPNDSLADTSAEVVDLVNHPHTRRINRRSLLNVIPSDFVDLCTPPSTGRRESQSSDVEITGVQQLPQRSSTNRRRKFSQTTNNNHEHEGGNNNLNVAVALSSAESTPKVIRSSASVADNTTSPDADSYKCPICLELVKTRQPTTTKCGHVFCYDCITTVLKVKPNIRKCPLCTKKIALRDLVRIYL